MSREEWTCQACGRRTTSVAHIDGRGCGILTRPPDSRSPWTDVEVECVVVAKFSDPRDADAYADAARAAGRVGVRVR